VSAVGGGLIRRSRHPDLPVILLENSGALIGLLLALLGVGLSVLTGNGIYDGIATVLIGVLLIGIAVVLAVETRSLIIGESAVPEQVAAIHTALLSTLGVVPIVLTFFTLVIGELAPKRIAMQRAWSAALVRERPTPLNVLVRRVCDDGAGMHLHLRCADRAAEA
jgi:hypothetical protein